MSIWKLCLASFVPLRWNVLPEVHVPYIINGILQCATFKSSHLVIDSICSGTFTWVYHTDRAHKLAGWPGHRKRACGSVSSLVRRGQVSWGEGCAALHTEGLCWEPGGHAVPGQQMGLWLLFPGLSYLTTSSLREQLFHSLHWDATWAAIFLPFFTLYIV